jgi:hypothetical protein
MWLMAVNTKIEQGRLIMQPGLLGLTAGTILLALSAAPASASVTEYTSITAFNAAVSGATTYNFEGIAPSFSNIVVTPTIGGVTFTADAYPGNIPFVIDASGTAFYGVSFFSGQSTTPSTSPSNVVATLAGATAIGFTYGSYTNSTAPFTVTLSTGDMFSLVTPAVYGVGSGFVGFTSSSPITSVVFAEPGGYAFDVASFTVASVPEPETWAMLLAGLGLVGFRLRGGRVTNHIRC